MGIEKMEFDAAVKNAFFDQLSGADQCMFDSPAYSEYFPLFANIKSELMQPLLGLIDQIPTENRSFRPTAKPDQSEKLLKRIALLIKSVHASIGDLKMKCLNKRQIWEEEQHANCKEMKQNKVKQLVEEQRMKRA